MIMNVRGYSSKGELVSDGEYSNQTRKKNFLSNISVPMYDFAGLPKIPPKFQTTYSQRQNSIQKNFPKSLQIQNQPKLRSRRKRKRVPRKLTPKNLNYLNLEKIRSKYGSDLEEIHVIKFNSEKLDGVLEEVQELINLQILELGDNNGIELHDLQGLGTLKELHLQCNCLTKILVPSGTFLNLQCLNLSFNDFSNSMEVFRQLRNLVSLQRVNLCGCGIRKLPKDLSSFKELVLISLETNKLRESCLQSLSTLPKIEQINVSRNFIKRIPNGLVFPTLRILSIGENYITYFEDLYCLKEFQTLKKVFVWENPICQRNEDLRTSIRELEYEKITVILNGPIPPPTSQIPMTQFFYNERGTVIPSYDAEKKRILRKVNKMVRKEREKVSRQSSRKLKEKQDLGEDSKNDKVEEVDDTTTFITELKDRKGKKEKPLPYAPASESSEFPSEYLKEPENSSKLIKDSESSDSSRDWYKLDHLIGSIKVDEEDPYFMGYSRNLDFSKSNFSKLPTRGLYKELKKCLDRILLVTEEDDLLERFEKKKKKKARKWGV